VLKVVRHYLQPKKLKLKLKLMSEMGVKLEIGFFMRHQATFCAKSFSLMLVTKIT
jgi:hypothetical protein